MKTQKVVRIAEPMGMFGKTQRQVVEIANQCRFSLLTNKEFDKRLVKTGFRRLTAGISPFVEQTFPAWSATMGAYEAPGKMLASTIQYADSDTKTNFVFEVPARFQGAKDIILAVSQTLDSYGWSLITYEDKGGNDVLVKVHDQSKIKAITAFPSSNGWYMSDPEFGIPTGKEVDSSSSKARFLSRLDGSPYVGLATRWYLEHDSDLKRYVDFSQQPSHRFGALVLAPE